MGLSRAGQTHNSVEIVSVFTEDTKENLPQDWGKIFNSKLTCYSRNLLVITPHINGGHMQKWTASVV
jgi:hypothetical protein